LYEDELLLDGNALEADKRWEFRSVHFSRFNVHASKSAHHV